MKIPALLFLTAVAHAGPYSGAAGSAGSEAIARNDARFVAWASGHSEVVYGTDVDSIWKTPAKATGPATNDPYDIVCLGNGGRITMHFPRPLRDGAGPDFAVFENAFGPTFLELAFVEVSTDGVNFHRFPSASLTASPVGAFGAIDPTNLSGVAGKHQSGHGTPFDLAALPDAPTLDKQRVVFVRIVDITGNGSTKDSSGRPIYDPTPTVGSGGFDLDAIGVIHQADDAFRMSRFTLADDRSAATLEWESHPGASYRVETCDDLHSWEEVEVVSAAPARGFTSRTIAAPAGGRRFWRVTGQ